MFFRWFRSPPPPPMPDLPPVPDLPPFDDLVERPPEHEPRYHEAASVSMNARVRIALAERAVRQRYIDTATDVLGGGPDDASPR